jgi:hypothetical protein
MRVILQAKGKRKRSIRKVAKDAGVCKETVRKKLHAAGLSPFRPPTLSKISEAGKIKRVKFAKDYLSADWNLVLMTDEKDFEANPQPNRRNTVVWAKHKSEVKPFEKQSWGLKVKCWGGVCAVGKTELLFYKGNLDAVAYQALLEKALPSMKALFGRKKWTFLHDGASAHKAASTNDWLKRHVPKFVSSGPSGVWPPNSPDLNWIENIWGIIVQRMEEYPSPPTNEDELKEKLRKIWNEIPISVLKKCAASMPQRLVQVIQRKGEALPLHL